jgi:hypothetical protein
MAARSRLMITEAERRFPVRVKVAVPPAGFGERFTRCMLGSTITAALTAESSRRRACAASSTMRSASTSAR